MIEFASPEDRLAAAGEYVLGTLSETDRETVAAALPRDPALLAEVYAWQDRLLGLSLHAPPLAPPPQLWPRIDSSLDAVALAAAAAAAGLGKAAPRPRWWQGLAPWQGLSAAALALCLLLGVALVQRDSLWPAAPNARYLALLQSPTDRSTGWVVEMEATRSLRLVPLAGAAAVPAGKSLQFWTKPQGAAGPTSLGLVRAGQTVELPISRLPAVGTQQLFEITLEPENGSPIDKPTGPILYVGRTIRL
ncbi:MAG: anti-sigma factor [Burkholderiaceae bacterium]